jgi:D-alanine-D-alanine ligase-like ATP-grasp enzyme
MTTFPPLPVPINQLLIWVLTPSSQIQQEWMKAFETNTFEKEMTDVFSELGLAWTRERVSLENREQILDKIASSTKDYIPVVLNFCDGLDELDGCPGISLIKLLETKGIIFIGADSEFYSFNLNKILIKQALIQSGVATSPYEIIADLDRVQGVCARLGTPLIVKPAVLSGGSYGLSVNSVVHSDEQIKTQVKHLLQENDQGMIFPSNSIFVESFINGREFSVFLIGSYQQPEKIKIYPPLETIFNPILPETEQFLSHDRYYGKDEGEISFSPETPFFRYQLVVGDLSDQLCDLSKSAYCAVNGNGYGRVDLRMDKVSQELFVLEVNANCAISSQPYVSLSHPLETKVGTILHLAGIPFAQVISEIITEVFNRKNPKT